MNNVPLVRQRLFAENVSVKLNCPYSARFMIKHSNERRQSFESHTILDIKSETEHNSNNI